MAHGIEMRHAKHKTSYWFLWAFMRTRLVIRKTRVWWWGWGSHSTVSLSTGTTQAPCWLTLILLSSSMKYELSICRRVQVHGNRTEAHMEMMNILSSSWYSIESVLRRAYSPGYRGHTRWVQHYMGTSIILHIYDQFSDHVLVIIPR